MQWFDWLLLIAVILSCAIGAFALYRSYNLTAANFVDVA